MFQEQGLKQMTPAETFRVAQYLQSRDKLAESRDGLCQDIYEATGVAMSTSRLLTACRMIDVTPGSLWAAKRPGGGAVRAEVQSLEKRVAAIERLIADLMK